MAWLVAEPEGLLTRWPAGLTQGPCLGLWNQDYESRGHSVQKPECPRGTSAGSGYRTPSAAREKGMEGVNVSSGWRRVKSHQPEGQEWGSLHL